MGKKRHSINMIFVVTLLCMFAFTALSVAVMGADVYRKAADNMTSNFETRTSLMYITEKVRQSAGENFELRVVDGADALVINDVVGGKNVESWIFVSGGYLKEALLEEGSQATISDGNKIMALKSMDISQDGPLMTITVENPSGTVNSMTIFRRNRA